MLRAQVTTDENEGRVIGTRSGGGGALCCVLAGDAFRVAGLVPGGSTQMTFGVADARDLTQADDVRPQIALEFAQCLPEFRIAGPGRLVFVGVGLLEGT